MISKEYSGSEVAKRINLLKEKYDSRLFKAFYSIEELRPFSIVQVDNILELYNKNEGWLSPDFLISKLNKKDSDLLLSRVIEYIDSFSPESRKTQILNKLDNWCKADGQFEFINKVMEITDTTLKDIILNINEKKGYDTQYFNIKSLPVNELSEEQKKFAYYQTINLLASMKMTQQFQYYSEVYSSLCEMNYDN